MHVDPIAKRGIGKNCSSSESTSTSRGKDRRSIVTAGGGAGSKSLRVALHCPEGTLLWHAYTSCKGRPNVF